MDEKEEHLLAATRRLTHERDIEAVVALLGEDLDQILGGQRSRAFTGLAFDAYCRALLASHGHGDVARHEVKGLCERSKGRFGDQPWSHLYEGCLFHLEGKDAAAAASYALASPGAEVLWPSSIGCRSVISPEQRATYLQASTQREAVRWDRSVPTGAHVLFAACDSTYLRRYAPAYLRSVMHYGGDCTVHIHLINAASDDLLWLKMESASLWAKLAVTTEVYEGPDQRAYFALARMLRFEGILKAYRRPVLATDIDAAFTAPIDTLEASTHVGLRFKHQNFHAHPWNTIQAGAVLISPSTPGVSFAKSLADIAAELFAVRAGSSIWFVDQNVLFSAYRQHSQESDLAFANLNRELPGGLRFGKNL